MSFNLNDLQSAVTESEDLTVDKKFERELPRAGVALLRFRDYIELGTQENKNPAFKAAVNCILTFELHHPDHLIEIEGKKVPTSITVRVSKGVTAKSRYRKLFNIMNEACGGGKRHFIEMIGKAFVAEVVHSKSKDGKTTYANLDKNDAYTIKAPVQTDYISGKSQPIAVGEMQGEPKVFLWENKTVTDEQIIAMWDSLYIEGERESDKKDADGNPIKVSKNWIQEIIQSAIDWEGSRTQSLTSTYVNLEAEETAAQPVPATDVDLDVPSL